MQYVVLKKGRDWSVRQHHPWIFSGAIASGSAASGETVAVVSDAGETLGYGSFSPTSQIRVRMLSFDAACVPDAAFIAARVVASVARRTAFFAPTATTNACRLINAESDGIPGVVADFYNGHVVCQFTSAGAEFWKGTITEALMGATNGRSEIGGYRVISVSERTDIDVRRKEGLACSEDLVTLAGVEPPARIAIVEGPIKYYVDPRKGHKTGFYIDQRDARAAVGALAAGRTVLNCFCYTGGFGLAAAAGGATHVTQVDVSREALALAQENAALTGVADRVETVEADVFQYLRQCRDARRTFDLIVLDPPKFAESKAQVMKAARGYKDINLLAMKLLNSGGILATFSCSGAMDTALFDKILAEAARDAHRDFQMIARTRQGLDHPVALSFPEGLYLKGVLLRAF